MANQYHYGYGAGNGSGREKKPTDWAYWIIALVLLLTFMPGGILMIVLKLAGGGKKKGRHPYYLQQEQRQGSVGARTVQAGAPANSAPRAGTVPPAAVLLNQMASKAKKLTLVGGILSAVFGFAAITEVADCLWILPDLAWFPIAFLSIWQGVAYSTLLYLAGLQTIDTEVYEAADIDGVNAWQRFWLITFPLIGPFFTINMVLSLKNSLSMFDQVVALTGGGPDSKTETVSYLIFSNGLGNGEYSYQMANAVTFFIVLAILAFIQLKFFSGKEQI